MGEVYRTTGEFAEEHNAAQTEIGTGNGATRQSNGVISSNGVGINLCVCVGGGLVVVA